MQRTGPAPTGTTASIDAALLERARDGDPDAFERLAASRLPGAWRLARAILDSDDDASEVSLDALLAAWRELPRLDDLARFDDWLDRIVISECRMRMGGSSGAGGDRMAPSDLLDRTMHAVRASPPQAAGRGRSAGRRGGRSWLTAAAGIPLLLVAALAAVVILPALAGGRLGQQALAPTSSPDRTSGPPPTGGTSPDPTIAPAGSGEPGVLSVGSLAMVTLEGDGLRVRTSPGISDASKRLKPLLPAGTRMLVVGGPVEAEGYTWYEIQTDPELIDLFGWVAAADEDVPWIAPAAPRCLGGLDAAAVTSPSLARIDFLACHGNAEVRLQAEARALWDVPEPAAGCPWWAKSRNGCEMDNAWLLMPSTPLSVLTASGERRDLDVALPPDLAPDLATALAHLPRTTTLTLALSMDSPDSTKCRVRDAKSGDLVVSADRAITACRLQFVIQSVVFRQPGASPPSG